MPQRKKRMLITVDSQLETALDALKKEKFYNTTRSEMLRCIIQTALDIDFQESEEVDTTPEK